jgi:DNA polymerase III gamma/tau subunit
MSLFDGTALITGARGKGESQVGFAFPASLSEKYRPHSLAEFVGLEKPKRVLSKFADAPFPSAAFLFVGPSGTGKIVRQCHYVPRNNTLHVVLVDESDQMTPAAQLAFLSKLDGTAFPPQTVFIFTANDTERLQDRFLSRCMVLQFSSHGMAKDAAGMLERIWLAEAGETAERPNFLRIVQDSKNNVRDAVNSLQVELLAL